MWLPRILLLLLLALVLTSSRSTMKIGRCHFILRIMTVVLVLFQVHHEGEAQRREADSWIRGTVSTFHLLMMVTLSGISKNTPPPPSSLLKEFLCFYSSVRSKNTHLHIHLSARNQHLQDTDRGQPR